MPSNYSRIKSHDKNQRIIRKTLAKVEPYAQALCGGNAKWRRVPIISDIVRLLSKCKTPWRYMGKKIRINQDRCIRCGLCAKLCPVNAISTTDDGIKKDHSRCEVCMRCISFCPALAIKYQSQKTYHAVMAKELLQETS